MNRIIRVAALSAALAVFGCGGEQEQAATETPMGDVEMAVAVARAIGENPASIDSVLAAHNLTRAGLDSLLYRIAADSAMSAAYEAGLR